MGHIESNIFNLNLDNFSVLYNENTNSDLMPVIKETIPNKLSNQADKLKEKIQNITINPPANNNSQINSFEEITITKENFYQYQYQLLNQKNISYIINDDKYKFLTLDYKLYTVSDEKLIKMILNMPKPRKVIYKHYSTTDFITPSIYSMQLLANVLENIKTNSLEELIKYYNFEYIDEYNSLHTILSIFEKYEKIIAKNQYSNYINFEQKIYNIFNSINYNIDDILLINRKTECMNLILQYLNELNIKDKVDVNLPLNEIITQISMIEDNDMIFPSINNELLHSINLETYTKFIEVLKEYKSILKLKDNTSVYDTYYRGSVDSFNPCIHKYTKKILIKGSYKNLFQHMLAEILRNTKFIDLVNEDKNILEYFLIRNNVSYNNNILLMLEWVLIAHLDGCEEEEQYITYIFENYSTILSNSDINKLTTIMNNELKDILDMIYVYSNNKLITDNIILYEEASPFMLSILSLSRKIIKNLILEVHEYIEDYNNKNNAKLYFIGFSNNTIYIECDPDALNVGIDTLTRTLVKIYDKYLKKTKAHCYIEKII